MYAKNQTLVCILGVQNVCFEHKNRHDNIEGRYKRNVCDMKYVRTINNWIFWENLDMLTQVRKGFYYDKRTRTFRITSYHLENG